MFEITPKMQAAYRELSCYGESPEEGVIVDALRDAVAAWMKLQWQRWGMDDNQEYPYGDYWEREKWTWEQWQAEAHKRLMGE